MPSPTLLPSLFLRLPIQNLCNTIFFTIPRICKEKKEESFYISFPFEKRSGSCERDFILLCSILLRNGKSSEQVSSYIWCYCIYPFYTSLIDLTGRSICGSVFTISLSLYSFFTISRTSSLKGTDWWKINFWWIGIYTYRGYSLLLRISTLTNKTTTHTFFSHHFGQKHFADFWYNLRWFSKMCK